MDLSGVWRAAPADEETRRAFAAPGFADDGWETMPVPAHWRTQPAFADHDGPVLYRRSFDREPTDEDRRTWIVFDGVFYQSDIWLNGRYLGDTEGYFFSQTLEITDALAGGREHTLAVEVNCSPDADPVAKRNLTGVFQHWDAAPPGLNPGGIWRPVRIEETGSVRLRRLSVICTDASEERALVRVRVEADAAEAGPSDLITEIGDGAEHVESRVLAQGENRLEWTVVVDEPDLWWPRVLGDQPLVDIAVSARLENGSVSDRRVRTTGLRSVRLRNWILSVNGERLFAKGTNLGPTRMALADATPAEIERDLDLAADANLDLVRVHAHVGRPELYDHADRIGMLVWQDMPLQWTYDRGVKDQAVRQAGKLVEQFGHHPSIVAWCGHNEPFAMPDNPADMVSEGLSGPTVRRMVRAQQLPNWNKSVLDRAVKRALNKADGSRTAVPHSGIWPHPPKLDGTDTHVYFGWYHGDERELPGFASAIPRMVRWVSEFGAQAVPTDTEFLEAAVGEAGDWPDLDWPDLQRWFSLQHRVFALRVPPENHPDLASWAEATRRYQATVLKHHIEHLRRLKYRPTGGFNQFLWADAEPGVTWAVLDHERRPKTGHEAMVAACAPVIVVADRLDEAYPAGTTLRTAVDVISDHRHALPGCEVTAVLHLPHGERRWRWAADLGPDVAERVGVVEAELGRQTGPVTLELTLEGPDVSARNRYESEIV